MTAPKILSGNEGFSRSVDSRGAGGERGSFRRRLGGEGGTGLRGAGLFFKNIGRTFAHFGALAGVGKGQRVSTACKVLHKMPPLAIN